MLKILFVATTAGLFILASVRVADSVQSLMSRELQHSDADQRQQAVLRFYALWRMRYQVWPRLEDGAQAYMKAPPPNIDFVLPSPTIGNPLVNVVDPPWRPLFKSKVEEVTINHEQSVSFNLFILQQSLTSTNTLM